MQVRYHTFLSTYLQLEHVSLKKRPKHYQKKIPTVYRRSSTRRNGFETGMHPCAVALAVYTKWGQE